MSECNPEDEEAAKELDFSNPGLEVMNRKQSKLLRLFL